MSRPKMLDLYAGPVYAEHIGTQLLPAAGYVQPDIYELLETA